MKKPITTNTQNLYDNFNGFILSDDIRIFNKLIMHVDLKAKQEASKTKSFLTETG